MNLCEPVLSVKNWRILLEQRFTAHMPLLMVRIRKKMLKFSSTVLPAPTAYMLYKAGK